MRFKEFKAIIIFVKYEKNWPGLKDKLDNQSLMISQLVGNLKSTEKWHKPFIKIYFFNSFKTWNGNSE